MSVIPRPPLALCLMQTRVIMDTLKRTRSPVPENLSLSTDPLLFGHTPNWYYMHACMGWDPHVRPSLCIRIIDKGNREVSRRQSKNRDSSHLRRSSGRYTERALHKAQVMMANNKLHSHALYTIYIYTAETYICLTAPVTCWPSVG